MMPTIFTTTDTSEDRQICERMVSKNLELAQRENILFLTGISRDSPYYSTPTAKKRSVFQFFTYHALRFAARVENPPIFPSIAGPASQVSSLSERVVLPSGCDPLTMPTASPSVAEVQANGPTVSPIPFPEEKRRANPAFSHYQLVLALQARLLNWRRPVPVPALVEGVVDAPAPLPVPMPQKLELFQPRLHSVNSSTGFVTPSLRIALFGLFGSEVDTDTNQEEITPLLTPLQRAIAQAREHGYHLHPRQSLSVSTSPISPSQPSPPGLAHMKHRYILRSHQVAAGDYFRKEASHRAAVATRNLNRHILIQKTDRSLYEPSGIIMPEYELTRLRVVQAPRRFPIRLWKREYRGPADCIEVEDRSPNGSPAIFKRDSHLRKELVLGGRRRGAYRKSVPAPPSVEERRHPIPVAVEEAKAIKAIPTVSPDVDQEVSQRLDEPSKITASQIVHLIQTMKAQSKVFDQANYESVPLTDDCSPYERKKGATAAPEDSDSSTPVLKPSGLRVDTELNHPTTPGCLDPVAAEIHRKSLLTKYYNATPKPVASATQKNIAESQVPAKPKNVDPSSSEETLCEEPTPDTVDKSKASSVEPRKEAPNVIVSSNIGKLRTGSNVVEDRYTRLSLSPRKALRAMKNQAKSLIF